MDSQLQLQQVSIELGGASIVQRVSLELKAGDIGCLLGPSGCGKTTLLRCIAGFNQPSEGVLQLSGALLANPTHSTPTEQRRVGMVFQDLALFPHLNVADNVAFGIRDQPRAARRERVQRLLSLVAMQTFAERYPHELSGGQQQRVALVRALAPKPKLLLLDEPFSSQDAERRERLAREVRSVLKEEHITTLLVTHDQNEAFAMADRIGVMHAGQLEQWDSAQQLYHRPSSAFVAGFIGDGSFLPGTADRDLQVETELGVIQAQQPLSQGQAVQVLLRPTQLRLDAHHGASAQVLAHSFRGAQQLYTLRLASGAEVQCLDASPVPYRSGDAVRVQLTHKESACFAL